MRSGRDGLADLVESDGHASWQRQGNLAVAVDTGLCADDRDADKLACCIEAEGVALWTLVEVDGRRRVALVQV